MDKWYCVLYADKMFQKTELNAAREAREKLKNEVTEHKRTIAEQEKLLKDRDHTITFLKEQAKKQASRQPIGESSPKEMVREIESLTNEKNDYMKRMKHTTEQYNKLSLTYSRLESDSASKEEQLKDMGDVNKQLSTENERLTVTVQRLQEEAQRTRSFVQKMLDDEREKEKSKVTETEQETPISPDFPALSPPTSNVPKEMKENVTKKENKKSNKAKLVTGGKKGKNRKTPKASPEPPKKKAEPERKTASPSELIEKLEGLHLDTPDAFEAPPDISKDVHLPPDIPRKSPVSGFKFMQQTEIEQEFSPPVTSSPKIIPKITKETPESQTNSTETTETSGTTTTSDTTEGTEEETSETVEDEQNRYFDEPDSEGINVYDYGNMFLRYGTVMEDDFSDNSTVIQVNKDDIGTPGRARTISPESYLSAEDNAPEPFEEATSPKVTGQSISGETRLNWADEVEQEDNRTRTMSGRSSRVKHIIIGIIGKLYQWLTIWYTFFSSKFRHPGMLRQTAEHRPDRQRNRLPHHLHRHRQRVRRK